MPQILVIEDDTDLLELMTTQVKELGYRPLAFQNGESCVRFLKSQKAVPDCCFLDLVLPGMSGVELLQWIRRSERHQRMPVVVMSGYRDEKLIKVCLKFGVKDFLLKPVEISVLDQRLKPLKWQVSTDQVRALLSECQEPNFSVYETKTFRRFKNKGNVPYTAQVDGERVILLADSSFLPRHLLQLDEDLLSHNLTLYADEAPWIPVWPTAQQRAHVAQRKGTTTQSAKAPAKDDLRQSIGEELFELLESQTPKAS